MATDRPDVRCSLRSPLSGRLAVAALSALLTGCAGVSDHYLKVEQSLRHGDPEQAVHIVESAEPYYGAKSRLLYRMDRGMTLHLAGKYESSSAVLEQAEQDVEAAYTRRVRTEAKAFLINDTELPYEGDPYEQVMINVIKAVNYAAEGSWSESLVEARRIDNRLALLAGQTGAKDGYRDDGLARYLSAVLYEAAGDMKLQVASVNGQPNKRIEYFRTGTFNTSLNNPTKSATTSINIQVLDSDGKRAFVSVPIGIYRAGEIRWDGNVRVAEREAPTVAKDCTPGGDIGVDVSFTEGQSIRRDRTWAMRAGGSLSGTMAPLRFLASMPIVGQIPFLIDSFAMQATASMDFGMDVSATVSIENNRSFSINKRILPGQFGVLYIQPTRLKRVGTFIAHGICGNEETLGDAVATDWLFTPDLATGPRCMPATNLPPPHKFED